MPPYNEEFPVGSTVRVADLSTLQEFKQNWKYHNKLTSDQLLHADAIAKVIAVGFYHGGDVLYQLEGIPGVWHEQCVVSLKTDGEK